VHQNTTKFIFDIYKNRPVVQSTNLKDLRKHFSVSDKLAHYKYRRSGRFMPARKHVIKPAGYFEIGLFKAILECIKKLNISHDVIITKSFKAAYKSNILYDKISKLNLTQRDYQDETIKACLDNGRGILEVATAGGKTLIMSTLIQTIRDNAPVNRHITLVTVPTLQLVEQTYKDFIEYGIDKNLICRWTSKYKLNPNAQIIISNTGNLISKNVDKNLYKDVDLLIADECHVFKLGNKNNKILTNIKTKHKFGFTGSMPENKIDQWNIIGKIGPVLYEKKTHELQKQKYVAKLFIKIIKVIYNKTLIHTIKPTFMDPLAQYNEEIDFIYNNEFRNNVIKSISKRVNNNILILVDKIEYGKKLQDICKNINNKNTYFIEGAVELEDRETVRDLMESNNNIICIAITKIFATGINIKNLHYVMFTAAGKAKVKIIQSIGRGLRLHNDKNKLVVFDISDNLKYSSDHLKKRISIYKKEKFDYDISEIKESKTRA